MLLASKVNRVSQDQTHVMRKKFQTSFITWYRQKISYSVLVPESHESDIRLSIRAAKRTRSVFACRIINRNGWLQIMEGLGLGLALLVMIATVAAEATVPT
mmetsp:Transcript_36234/g.55660  ORF Transcript_36234/g.55660 Transcript_36234/m.55660 type:complete len:101 (+) Transcript_36234:98-400(+)